MASIALADCVDGKFSFNTANICFKALQQLNIPKVFNLMFTKRGPHMVLDSGEVAILVLLKLLSSAHDASSVTKNPRIDKFADNIPVQTLQEWLGRDDITYWNINRYVSGELLDRIAEFGPTAFLSRCLSFLTPILPRLHLSPADYAEIKEYVNFAQQYMEMVQNTEGLNLAVTEMSCANYLYVSTLCKANLQLITKMPHKLPEVQAALTPERLWEIEWQDYTMVAVSDGKTPLKVKMAALGDYSFTHHDGVNQFPEYAGRLFLLDLESLRELRRSRYVYLQKKESMLMKKKLKQLQTPDLKKLEAAVFKLGSLLKFNSIEISRYVPHYKRAIGRPKKNEQPKFVDYYDVEAKVVPNDEALERFLNQDLHSVIWVSDSSLSDRDICMRYVEQAKVEACREEVLNIHTAVSTSYWRSSKRIASFYALQTITNLIQYYTLAWAKDYVAGRI